MNSDIDRHIDDTQHNIDRMGHLQANDMDEILQPRSVITSTEIIARYLAHQTMLFIKRDGEDRYMP